MIHAIQFASLAWMSTGVVQLRRRHIKALVCVVATLSEQLNQGAELLREIALACDAVTGQGPDWLMRGPEALRSSLASVWLSWLLGQAEWHGSL